MEVVISLDTADYLTPQAADAQKWWADELLERNIRGSFQVVGEVVRFLRRQGRLDTLQSLGRHEIGYHTNYHCRPPVHPVAIEGMGLDRGIEWIYRNEAEGVMTLVEQFGRVPISYCQPGLAWTPHTMIAMAAMGIPVSTDIPFPKKDSSPYWFCGQLCVQYHVCMDIIYAPEDDSGLEEFKREYIEAAENLSDDAVMVIYTHPSRLYTSRLWEVIFEGGAEPSPSSFQPAPLWPKEKIQRNKDKIRLALDWLGKQEVRFVDHARVYSERPEKRRTLRMLLDDCGLKPGEEGILPLVDSKGDTWLSKAELDQFKYNWEIMPRDFRGRKILEQTSKLLWTSGPAGKPDWSEG